MKGIRLYLCALVATSACSVGASAPSAYPQQMAWVGPPGGAIDPGYGYDVPLEGDGSYEGSYPPSADEPMAPSADPADPNYAFGAVSDAEIEAALQGQGEWIWADDYGYVWLPYTTVVGADFTPYESSGDWVYTDYGWSFASDYDWGWLAFHFGRWTYFDDSSWGWVPDHQWGSSWCEWRHGGSTIGWRPMGPQIRDHRTASTGTWRPSNVGPANGRRPHPDPNNGWRFAAQTEFGLRSRPTAFAQADGFAITQPVTRPPAGELRGQAAALMGGRLRTKAWRDAHPTIVRPNVDTRAGFTGGRRPWGGAGELGQSTAGGRTWQTPPSPWGTSRPDDRAPQRPTWNGSNGSSWNGGTYEGGRTWTRPNDRTPQRPSWNGGSSSGSTYQRGGWTRPTDRAPQRPSWNGGSSTGGSAYQGSRTWSPPSDRAPQRPSWNGGSSSGGSAYQGSRTWSPPSDRAPQRPSWNGSSGSRPSYSPPSRPSYSSGSSGSFSPSSGGSRSYGSSSSGGSRSYGSSSSSSSGSSRSYGSSSSSGSSGSSRSSGSSSSSGGGRRR